MSFLRPRAIWRGNPPTPDHQPDPVEIVRWEEHLESIALNGVNRLASCTAVAVSNRALTGEQTIDGVSTSTSSVLLTAQSDPSQNGIWVTAAGAWARRADANTSEEIAHGFVYVIGGTTYGGTAWAVVGAPDLGLEDVSIVRLAISGEIPEDSDDLPEGSGNLYLTVDNFEAMVDAQTEYEGFGNDDKLQIIVAGALRWLKGSTLADAIKARLGGMFASADEKAEPADADKLGFSDSENASATVRMSFGQLAAWAWSKIGPSIAGATAKGGEALVDADGLVISDSGNLGVSRRVILSALMTYIWKSFGAKIAGGTQKVILSDGDRFVIADADDSNAPKRVSFAQMVASIGLGAAAFSNDYDDLDNLPLLGTAAEADADDFATAAQGAKADTAVQPGALGSAAAASADAFAPAAHDHAISDVTGLQDALNGKSGTGHKHGFGDLNDIGTDGQHISGAADKIATTRGVKAATAEIANTMEQRVLFHTQALGAYSAVSPGLVFQRFASEYEGSAVTMAGFVPDDIESTRGEGNVLRVFGSGLVSTRDVIRLEPGRKYEIRWRGRRAIDSDDPEGDAVEFGIAWLNHDQVTDGLSVKETIVKGYEDAEALTFSDGWVGDSAVISLEDLTGVDHFNGDAVYARPFVRQYGSGERPVMDVSVLAWDDVSGAEIPSDITGDALARIAALENADPLIAQLQASGTDLDTLTAAGEYYVASPVNSPDGAANIVGVSVRAIDANTSRQEVWDANGSNGGRWWRVRVADTYGSWQPYASQGYVDTQIQALANSIAALGMGSGTSTPSMTTDVASNLSVTYGSRYLRWTRILDVVMFSGTISFTPTWSTGGTGRILIGPLPVAADVESGRNTVPVILQPSGHMEQPAGFLTCRGHLEDQDPEYIILRMERAAGAGTEVRDIALSELTSGVTVNLTFQGTYHAMAS